MSSKKAVLYARIREMRAVKSQSWKLSLGTVAGSLVRGATPFYANSKRIRIRQVGI